jgi:hypothetical protein
MTKTRRSWLAIACAGAFVVAGVARAQTATDNPSPSRVTVVETVSVVEMKVQAEAIIGRIGAVTSQVSGMLENAREDRNVVRVLCLTDKSNQVDLALGTAKDRQSGMLAALSRGAEGRARHEFRLLLVVGDRVELVSAEANVCLGAETSGVGQATLTMEVDPTQPTADPGIVSVTPVVSIVPVVASGVD